MAVTADVGSTITIAYLSRQVSRYLGYGRGAALGANEELDVEDVIESGLREFYWHQFIEEGETAPHVWSFLRDEQTLATIAGTFEYPRAFTDEIFRLLPGKVVISGSTSDGFMSVISDGDMRALHATDVVQGVPKYVSVLGNTVTVHPIPDDAYNIKFPIAVVPSTTDDLPVGPVFTEVVVASCLAAADRLFNKEKTENAERFQALLQAAVKYDRQMTDIPTEQIWPVDSESGIGVNKDQLDKLIGHRMGFPADPSIWSSRQVAEVDEARKEGLRNFYWHKFVEEGETNPHIWSFLRDESTVTTIASTWEYEATEPYRQLLGRVVIFTGTGKGYMTVISDGDMRALQATDTGEDEPKYISVLGDKLRIHPIPDDAYVIKYPSVKIPDSVDDIPVNEVYAGAVVASCMVVADRAAGKDPTDSDNQFNELLQAAVKYDRQITDIETEPIWPVDSESGIGINKDQLDKLIGRNMGFPTDPSVWSSRQVAEVDEARKEGLREFYWHRFVEEGDTAPHIWSFLRSETTISAKVGVWEYTSTEPYRQLLGAVVIFSGDNKGLMTVISDGDMRALHATDNDQGEPKYIAVLGDTIRLHPIPDGSYTIKYPSVKIPDSVDDLPVSEVYAEAVLVSCLSAADRAVNKDSALNDTRFQVLLQAAVKYDRQLTDIATDQVWPEDYSSTLELTKNRLDRIVGVANGFPPDPDLWAVGQKAEVKEIVRAGLHKFYNPPVLPGDRYPHEWSFMMPTITFSLKAETHYYDLPEDYAMLAGPIVYANNDALYEEIAEISENRLRRRIQQTYGSSKPVVYATWVKEFDQYEGTRWEIGFEPAPDEDVDVTIRYKVNPDGLAPFLSQPMGGTQYSQTIIEACLSALEIAKGKAGVHTKEFEKLIIASVRHDRNASTPDYLDTEKVTAAYGYGYDNHIIQYGDLDID